jgi:hypothetical protein
MAPRDHSALYILVPTPNTQPAVNQVDWNSSSSTLRERTLDQLESIFGVGDIRGVFARRNISLQMIGLPNQFNTARHLIWHTRWGKCCISDHNTKCVALKELGLSAAEPIQDRGCP